MGLVRNIVERADSWVNAMTGLGTLRDKLMHTQVVAGTKLTDPVLEALFNDDDVARRVVAKLPRDATRRGFRIKITEQQQAHTDDADDLEPEPADEYESATARRAAETSAAQTVADEAATIERQLQQAFTRLEAMPKLRDGWIWARLYGGGSGIFVGADDGQDVDQPLNEDAIRSIKFLNVIKRPQLSIFARYEDIREPQYAKPELYTVNQASGILAPRTGLTVHESRLILFDGALTARMTMESPTGFDDSVLQSTMAALQQTASAWQSIAHLMTDASQGVLKIANLVDLVAAGGTETLRSRIQLMDLARSVCRAILVDAEKESFERVSTSFAGLPEVMDRLMQRMCAAAEQPATLLYGRSPAGMNATGESDIRGWYDTCAEAQTDELKPRLERLVRLMFLAKDGPTLGREPDDWCIEFNPLWLPTDKELAETKKLKADTYVALVGGNIMTDAEAGIGLAPDFPEIDVESRAELAEADKEEGVRPREVNTPEPPPMPGGDEGGGGTGTVPKGRSDSQPREPAGSAKGGQFASTAASGGAHEPYPGKAPRDLTPEEFDQPAPNPKVKAFTEGTEQVQLDESPLYAERFAKFGKILEANPHYTADDLLREAYPESRAKAEEWTKRWRASSAAGLDDVREGMIAEDHWFHDNYAANQAVLRHRLPELQRQGLVDADGYVTLYRGIKRGFEGTQLEDLRKAFDTGGDMAKLATHEASSWTSKPSVGRYFGGYDGLVVVQKMHYSRAFTTEATAGAGFRKDHEWEWVPLNLDGQPVAVHKHVDLKRRTDSSQPRVPAGSPQGGQFASSGGGGGVSAYKAKAKKALKDKASKALMVKAKAKLEQQHVQALEHAAKHNMGKFPMAALEGLAQIPTKPGDEAINFELKAGAKALLKEHAKVAKAEAKAEADAAHEQALADAKVYKFHTWQAEPLKQLAMHSMDEHIKAAATAQLKQIGVKVSTPSGARKPGSSKYERVEFEEAQPNQLAGDLLRGHKPVGPSEHASAEGNARSVLGPLDAVSASPHQAALDTAAKAHASSFEVVAQAIGKDTAMHAHEWTRQWVSQSTDKGAENATAHINDPSHHLHAQYHATQALLRHHMPELVERGIVDAEGYVTLYRGVKGDPGGGAPNRSAFGAPQGVALERALAANQDGSAWLDTREVSSWTASHGVARSFAQGSGTVAQSKVHVSNALVVHNFESHWRLNEVEWALVTPEKGYRVVRADESRFDPYASE